MSAVPHDGPSLLATALAKVDDFFFEKVADPAAPAALAPHPRVVVAGLGPRTGATTIARALAVELAARADGGAIVTTSALPARAAPASRSARRLAVAFGDRPLRATGRLCAVAAGREPSAAHDRVTERGSLGASVAASWDGSAAVGSLGATAAAARYLAPFVADWSYGLPAADALELGAPVVLVATPATEPALAAAVAAAVPGSVVVLNRDRPFAEWGGHADLAVPEARLHARLALAGRPVSGRFGAAIAALAERTA